MLARALLDRLVCPRTKQPLVFVPAGADDPAGAEGWLFAAGARVRYRISQGVPVLLADDGEALSDAALSAMLTRAGSRP